MRFGVKRRGRSEEEKLTDLLLLLYLIWNSQKRGYVILGETKLQKLVFLAERQMLGKRYKGFNYNFARLDFGPYSSELKRDLNLLLECNLVIDDPRKGFVVSRKGEVVLKEVSPLFERYKEFLEIIEEVNEKYAGLSLDELLELVYSMSRPLKGARVTIGEVKHRTPLLRRIEERRASKVFRLGVKEQLILRIVLDPSVEEWEWRVVDEHKVLVFRMRREGVYSAIVPKLPGCCSQGRTKNQALANVEEALRLYLEE